MDVERETDDKKARVVERNSALEGSSNRSVWLCRCAVVLLAIALWLPRLSGPIDLRWDAAVYYLLGTSLAQSQTYRLASEPGLPQAIQYPPLLPAFVAVHEIILSTNDPAVVAQALRRSYAVIFLLFGLAVFELARQFLVAGLALVASFLCMLHHLTVFLSDLLFAELPFAVVSASFVVVAITRRKWKPLLRETVSFVLAAAAFLLRSAGIVLFLAWILEALFRRRWRVAVIRAGLALLPVIAWQTYISHVRGSEEYRRPAYAYQRAAYQFSNVTYWENTSLVDPYHPEIGKAGAISIAGRLLTNLPWLTMAVGEVVSADADSWPSLKQVLAHLSRRHSAHKPEDAAVVPMGDAQRRVSFQRFKRITAVPIFALAALVVLGMVNLAWRGAWLPLFVIMGTLAIVALTPWREQFTRYLMPLMPFLTICALLGFLLIQRVPGTPGLLQTIARWSLLGLLLLTCAIHALTPFTLFRLRAAQPAKFLAGGIGHVPRFFAHDSTWQNWEEAANWISANAPHEAIVATSAPHLLYLLNGHRAVLPPMELDPDQEQQLLDTVPVSYTIVDQLRALDVTRRYVRPAMERDDNWREVWSHGGTQIYARATLP